MKELTRAEEEIMQILWETGGGYVRDIIERIEDEPKPAYNTVSTIVRILEKKGFVGHEAVGGSHRYFPLVPKEEYSRARLRNFVKNYFNNSYKRFASFFAKDSDLSLSELEELRKIFEDEAKSHREEE